MKALYLCLLSCFFINLSAQNYIGLHKDSLAVELKKNEKTFRIDKSTVNKAYKYDKYVDRINEQTWLFFLDENDICTYHKLMSDYLNITEWKGKLNEQYKNIENNNWEYAENGKTYLVNLSEDEWYFTILTKPRPEK